MSLAGALTLGIALAALIVAVMALLRTKGHGVVIEDHHHRLDDLEHERAERQASAAGRAALEATAVARGRGGRHWTVMIRNHGPGRAWNVQLVTSLPADGSRPGEGGEIEPQGTLDIQLDPPERYYLFPYRPEGARVRWEDADGMKHRRIRFGAS
jgi:hypothetical protein